MLAESSKRAMARKEAKAVTKMMKGMKVGDKAKRTLQDSSDESDSDSEQAMQVDDSAAANVDMEVRDHAIKKKKTSRAYFVNLKKTLRRKIKSGIILDESKIDDKIAKLKAEIGMTD